MPAPSRKATTSILLGSTSVDLTSITHALHVAEHLGFSRAAATLGIDPSAISRRVAALEDQLGVSLFERSGRGVRLTPAGRRFLEQARAGLQEIDNAVKHAATAGRGADGAVRLGLVSSISHGFVRELILRFRAAHPGVELELVDGAQHSHVLALGERELDAAILVEGSAISHCESLPLWRSRVSVVLHEDHPLAQRESLVWGDLKAETFIVTHHPPGPETQNRIIQRLAGPHCNPVVVRYSVLRDTMLHMVGLGFGIVLVSEGAIGTPYPGVVFRPLVSNEDVLSYTAVWLAENDNPALRRLISLARSLAKAWPQA